MLASSHTGVWNIAAHRSLVAIHTCINRNTYGRLREPSGDTTPKNFWLYQAQVLEKLPRSTALACRVYESITVTGQGVDNH